MFRSQAESIEQGNHVVPAGSWMPLWLRYLRPAAQAIDNAQFRVEPNAHNRVLPTLP